MEYLLDMFEFLNEAFDVDSFVSKVQNKTKAEVSSEIDNAMGMITVTLDFGESKFTPAEIAQMERFSKKFKRYFKGIDSDPFRKKMYIKFYDKSQNKKTL